MTSENTPYPTSVSLSKQQKLNLMITTGETNLTAAVRRVADERWIPVVQELSDQLKLDAVDPLSLGPFDLGNYIAARLLKLRTLEAIDERERLNNLPLS